MLKTVFGIIEQQPGDRHLAEEWSLTGSPKGEAPAKRDGP
jgi:hypothetical protein